MIQYSANQGPRIKIGTSRIVLISTTEYNPLPGAFVDIILKGWESHVDHELAESNLGGQHDEGEGLPAYQTKDSLD